MDVTQVAVSAVATLIAAILLAAAVRNLFARGRSLPPQKLPPIAANLVGLAAFLGGMLAGRRFWP